MADFDFNQSYNAILNAAQYKGRKARKFLRQRLNASPATAYFDGDAFNYANNKNTNVRGWDGSNGWSRREVKNLVRYSRNNWDDARKKYDPSQMSDGAEDQAKKFIWDQAAKGIDTYSLSWTPEKKGALGLNYLYDTDNWFPRLQPNVPDYLKNPSNSMSPLYDPLKETREFIQKKLYPMYRSFQQGGQFTSGQAELDQDEQIVLLGMCAFIGANPDKTLQDALQAVVPAYIQDPNSLAELVQNEQLVKKGASIIQQKEPQALAQLQQPGTIKGIMQQAAQQTAQVQSAKRGAKLEYIKELKKICPEGYELVYMKQGGTMCPVCNKVHKPVQAKCGKKITKNCGGSKVMSAIKAQMACGGKVKKHEEGGIESQDKKPRNNEIRYTPAQRDSMITKFNSNPDVATYQKIQQANRQLADWDDENPTKGKRIDPAAIKKIKLLQK